MDTDIIIEYQNMIYNLANKFYGVSKEDLIQAGFLGLIKAYKNFDQTTNAKFSSYAYPYIKGEMFELVSKSNKIKLQKESYRIYKQVQKTKELLTQKYLKEVSYDDVANYLGLDKQMLYDILNSLNDDAILDEAYTKSFTPNIDDLIMLKDSLNELNTLEKQVIDSRYFDDYSQDETAKKLGLTQVKVSRIEKKSKEKIKKYINT